MKIQGKHVLITGSAKRLGLEMAQLFLQHGAKITAHYRTPTEALSKLSKENPNVFPIQADLTDFAKLPELVSKSISALGPIDILINSASDFEPCDAVDCTEAQWDNLMNINLKSHFFLSQAVAKHMLQQNQSVIINLCDVNAQRARPRYTPYVISKAGLLMMTKNLAKEWAPKIRVNSISPGAVLLPDYYTEEQKERAMKKTLLQRLGTANDIAQAALFLATQDYMTGYDLAVDGGRSLV